MKDEIFRSNESFTTKKLMSGKSIFIKYWLIGEPYLSSLPYYNSILPGIKEGISGTSVAGNNLGIIKNIAKEKKDAAFEVVKFFTSKEYQKRGFEDSAFISAINEFWYDEELCKKNGSCDIYKNVQFTAEPKFIQEEQEDYRKKYQDYIYQYLYENKTIDETLKHINDIKKIYYISLNTENSYVGLICFIYFFIISALILSSLIFLFQNNFHPFFTFLPKDFWIITVLGSILILWVPIISYGSVTTLKCHLKPILMSIGYTFSVCPSLYKLIVQFPKENRISPWVNDHKYMFLLFSILMDIIVNCISIINPFTSQSVLVEDGESFKICKFNGEYSIIILLVYKLFVIFLILFLIFVERNHSLAKYDLKFIVSAIYIDILSLIIIFIYHFSKIRNYISYFLLKIVITFIISISNHIFLYFSRIFLKFIKKEELTIEEISTNNFKIVFNVTSTTDSNFKSNNVNYTDNSDFNKLL